MFFSHSSCFSCIFFLILQRYKTINQNVMNEKFLKAKMKKIFIMMFAFVSLTASAQGIKSGSKWNISNLVYEAKVNTDKTITFTAMAEGEELAFRLTPNNSKKNEFVLSEELNADGFNPFSKTPRAKYIEKEGWKLICLYDQKGNLHNVLDGSFFGEGEKVAMGKWMEQIMGKYVDGYGDTLEIGYGDTLEIGHEVIYEKGVARAEYKNIAFNGTVTGVLRISGLTDLEGTWEAVQTLDGLTLIEVEQYLCLPYLKEPTQSWKQIAEFWAEAFKELMNMKPPLDPTMTEEHEIDVEDLSRFYIKDRKTKKKYPLYAYDERGFIIVNPVLLKFMDNHMKFKIRIGVGESSYSAAKFDSREMMVHVAGSVITARKNDDIEIEIRPSDLSYYRYIKIEVIN